MFFNFLLSENNGASGEASDSSVESIILNWIPAKPLKLSSECISNLIEENLMLQETVFGSVRIKYFSQECVSAKIASGCVSSAITLSQKSQSDLLPAVYEGGLKIWECTWDLLDYLSKLDYQWSNKRVAEFGCGAGLVGIFAVCKGSMVAFQDYNEDVITHVTVPNLVHSSIQCKALETSPSLDGRNKQETISSEHQKMSNEDLSKLLKRVEFYSGDWGSLAKVIKANFYSSAQCDESSQIQAEQKKSQDFKFDLILSSETLYNTNNYSKLLNAMMDCLKPSGIILLASKSYYFGVGGGTYSFLQAVDQTNSLQHRLVWHQDQGLRREIIEIKFK